MINGFRLSFSVCAAAQLGVADAIGAGARSVEEIARDVGAHAPSLYRLLRAIAADGVFTEVEPGRFANTPLSDVLKKDHPASMHGLASVSLQMHLRAWPEILHSVTTGGTAMKKAFGAEIFEHLATDKTLGHAFDAAMAGYTRSTARAAAAALDLSAFPTLVDVGGGNGALLAEALAKNPAARGVLVETAEVCARARGVLADQQLSDRVDVVVGDFFASVPTGGDAYLMKSVLHDWDDERALAILKNTRTAMMPTARLFILEAVLPPGNAPSPGKLLDINMLVMTGGRERTADEFRALLKDAGFALGEITPVDSTFCVIEARPA